ncbi:MAG: Acyl-CoA thioesterase 2 [Burkholderia lata]|uniref:Acyl-CoA thioesterase 2 n=2 Tax=Burkholderia lata (strain ATCC 17760 / DSM 23089 / LMG 22485 / NCIMB 9086 / R18194 / 383) TaxID=482957 RepID=A0A833PP88_BURL3|nr:MAG: Acyl-CoA thioesterase 2 [Burkholderia lata]
MSAHGSEAMVDERGRTEPAMPTGDATLSELLTLDPVAPGRWRSRRADPNANARIFGGQLLGQAMAAALDGVPENRTPTMMQALFLHGALPGEPLDFETSVLQEGKRFSSRRVSAWQPGGRAVLDAQVTCAIPLDAPRHGEPTPVPAGERPESLPSLCDLPDALFDTVRRLGGYDRDCKPSIEFRIPDPARQLSAQTSGPRFRYWMRAARPLPCDARIHAAAFAYLSDWWLNFSALALHQRAIGTRRLYICSLNHGLWLHRPVQADAWLHVETISPAANAGCGLSIAKIHDAAGDLVASASQQTLMTFTG